MLGSTNNKNCFTDGYFGDLCITRLHDTLFGVVYYDELAFYKSWEPRMKLSEIQNDRCGRILPSQGRFILLKIFQNQAGLKRPDMFSSQSSFHCDWMKRLRKETMPNEGLCKMRNMEATKK